MASVWVHGEVLFCQHLAANDRGGFGFFAASWEFETVDDVGIAVLALSGGRGVGSGVGSNASLSGATLAFGSLGLCAGGRLL